MKYPSTEKQKVGIFQISFEKQRTITQKVSLGENICQKSVKNAQTSMCQVQKTVKLLK